MSSARKTSRLARQPGAASRNIIGERLRLARHHHAEPLSAEALSALIAERSSLEITPNMLSKIENGLRSAYDYEVLAFADVLEVSADWLLGRTDRKTFP